MADSVNDKLFDLNTRHQIGLTRLAAGTAAKLVDVLNSYDKKLAKILGQVGASTSKTQLNKVLREFRKTNIAAYLKVEKEMKKSLKAMAVKEAAWQKDALKQATPADAYKQMQPKLPTSKSLRDMVDNQPLNGALLEEHINGMEQGRYNRVRDVLRREVATGGTDAAVRDAIQKGILGTAVLAGKDGLLDYSRRSLDKKTRTLHNGVAQETRGEFTKTNDDIFDGVQWVSVLDNRTSYICMELDGTVFPVDEGPRPPAHENCRSEVVPIVKDWEAMGLSDLGPGTRETMTGEVPETQTYNEWLRSQPKEIQDEILGPNRGELFRNFELDVGAFTDDTGRTYTLDELFLEHKGEVYWQPGLRSEDEELLKQWTDSSPLQTLDEVMEAAGGNQKLLSDALEAAVREHGINPDYFKDPGVKKDMERIQQKLLTRTPARLTDIVRGGVKLDHPAQGDAILDSLRKQFQVMDEGWKINDANYFDRKAMVRMPNGQVAELQLWQPDLLKAKNDTGHALYEDWRKLDDKSPEAQALMQEMRDLYGPIIDGLSDEWKNVIPDRSL